jgi:hypothetical protein
VIYYLYKTINLTNNKFYIGVHQTTDINDGYLGSGKELKKDIKKFGKNNFTKEILQFFNTKEEMFLQEAEIVNFEFCTRDDTYNVMPGGGFGSAESNGLSFKNKKHTEAAKEKLRIANLGKKMSKEAREKMSKNNFARRNPVKQKEHAKKIASFKKTAEHKEKIRQSLLNTLSLLKNNTGKHFNLGKKRITLICPHCEKEGSGKHVMYRHHFENCKLRITG